MQEQSYGKILKIFFFKTQQYSEITSCLSYLFFILWFSSNKISNSCMLSENSFRFIPLLLGFFLVLKKFSFLTSEVRLNFFLNTLFVGLTMLTLKCSLWMWSSEVEMDVAHYSINLQLKICFRSRPACRNRKSSYCESNRESCSVVTLEALSLTFLPTVRRQYHLYIMH